MSLRTKLMVSIFVFMVLGVGLLTLNLWLSAAARAQREAQRNADMVASMVSYWVLESAPPSGIWSEQDWTALARKIERWDLVEEWTLAGVRDSAVRVIATSGRAPERPPAEEEAAFRAAVRDLKVDQGGTRVYVPIPTAGEERAAARLDLKSVAAPVQDLGEVLKGILTIMAIGAALLLLNVYVFTNRLVLRPLDALVEASTRVAGGDFTKKIPEQGVYDEMGRLIQAFNLMIEKTAEYHRTLQADIVRARGRITETERKLFAAQRLSTTGTLAAGIAHEINNPLGGMINAARSLGSGGLDAAKREEYLGLIADGLERVRAIVQKILQFRPRPFEPQPVALREAVEKAVAFLDHRARAKEVTVRNELAADLPAVQGDALELQQAFLNLLMNAVDACVMGEGMITVFARAEADRVRVSIADNGCGMEEAELARCMDPFFTTKDVGEGTGLGLSVAHNIITNHGGKIDIESARGRGTTVTVSLPLARERMPVPG
jgi:signal transduction histidine kinase